ncbi:MAG: HIT family protein [Myxococcales bacterium]|nr:HIT family protein [Myxococcales bacterium]
MITESVERCLLCPPLLEGERIALRNAHCLFLRQPEPVLIGSGIIVPIRHRETVFDLMPDEWQATLALLREAKALVDREHGPSGYNVGWNCGHVAGQEVFHAHMHVIPRYEDEPLAGKGIRYWLKQDANRRSS